MSWLKIVLLKVDFFKLRSAHFVTQILKKTVNRRFHTANTNKILLQYFAIKMLQTSLYYKIMFQNMKEVDLCFFFVFFLEDGKSACFIVFGFLYNMLTEKSHLKYFILAGVEVLSWKTALVKSDWPVSANISVHVTSLIRFWSGLWLDHSNKWILFDHV